MKYNNKYFDEQFVNYSQQYGNGWGMNWRAYMKLRMHPAMNSVKEIISKKEKCTILEVGCATGDFIDTILESIRDSEGKIVGADISDIAISICKEKYRKYKCIEFVNVQLPCLEYKNEFDCVICMDVLEYFDLKGQDKCVQNLVECLKIGGKLVLQLPLGMGNEKAILEIVEKKMKIQSVDYVYGKIWFTFFEKTLVLLVNTLLVNKKLGVLGAIIGRGAYKICASIKLVENVFKFNKKYFPNKKSHIVITATK